MIPKDPMMLYGFINMKLRDEYNSLTELCDGLDINQSELVETLASVGFEYSEEHNKFW
ncbi:MAG: DUF4250 domain-containing protein [Bacteroidales bacterium]